MRDEQAERVASRCGGAVGYVGPTYLLTDMRGGVARLRSALLCPAATRRIRLDLAEARVWSANEGMDCPAGPTRPC